jgi:SAM-dependent methyltransferase
MRAIHRIAPDETFRRILEVGGGQSGLTARLYPEAEVINLEINCAYSQAPCNRQARVCFVCGDATALPFGSHCFDAVTIFDALEHIPEDERVVSELLQILRPGGSLLISTPNENWRFPYYGFMRSICPSDMEIMAAWGHVRRGYTLHDLEGLLGLARKSYANYITPLTVLSHDIAFSTLSSIRRAFFCTALSPLAWLGYALQKPHHLGTGTASSWQKG